MIVWLNGGRTEERFNDNDVEHLYAPRVWIILNYVPRMHYITCLLKLDTLGWFCTDTCLHVFSMITRIKETY